MEKTNKNEVILPYDGYFTEEDTGMSYNGQEMKKKIFVRPFWSWQTFFGISGRLGRGMYILYAIFISLVIIGLIILSVLSANYIGYSVRYWREIGDDWIFLISAMSFSLWVLMIFAILIFIPINARRLHDLNVSAWFVILMILFSWMPLVWIVIMCIPGTNGNNRFGPLTSYRTDLDEGKLEKNRKERIKRDDPEFYEYLEWKEKEERASKAKEKDFDEKFF